MRVSQLLNNSYQVNQPEIETGIVISDASEENIGKILMCNSVVLQGLGYSPDDLRYQRISILLPQLINCYHSQFMNNFLATGCSNMFNHKRNVFMKKKNGYIAPVQMYMEYHFSKDFGHIFISYVTFLKEIQLNPNNPPVPTEDVMFVISNHKDNRIYDFTENCYDLMGLDINYLNSNML